MSPETILQKEDCEVPRTAEELIVWIESVHAKFGATDATRTHARLGTGLAKAFYEEIVPLGDLALHKYLEKPNFYLRPKIGNQNYDAEIIHKSSGREYIKRIEFTSTHRNADLALRLEYLSQHGGVFMSGPVWRDGTKASRGKIHVVPECVDYDNNFDGLKALIEQRVSIKLGLSYASNTIIAIVFDDSSHRSRTHMPQLQAYLRDTLSNQIRGKFCGIFILGTSGKTFLEYGETAQALSG